MAEVRAFEMEGLKGRVVIAEDVVYGRAGGRALLLDLLRPAAQSKRLLSAVVFIHGGGWGGGDKNSYHDLAAKLAARGYVCATPNYRLSGEAHFPAGLEDCKCAVRWLRAHASEHGVAVERIATWGHSAGAHLAAMVAVTPGKFEGDGGWAEQSSAVACALCFSTPFDLADRALGLIGIIDQFIGTGDDAEAVRAQASANTHVAGCKAAFLLMHGIEDVLPIAQSDRFAEDLRKAGVPFESVRVPGAGHDLERFSPEIFETAAAFAARHLNP